MMKKTSNIDISKLYNKTLSEKRNFKEKGEKMAQSTENVNMLSVDTDASLRRRR